MAEDRDRVRVRRGRVGEEVDMNPKEQEKSTSTDTGTRREFLRRAGAAGGGSCSPYCAVLTEML